MSGASKIGLFRGVTFKLYPILLRLLPTGALALVFTLCTNLAMVCAFIATREDVDAPTMAKLVAQGEHQRQSSSSIGLDAAGNKFNVDMLQEEDTGFHFQSEKNGV